MISGTAIEASLRWNCSLASHRKRASAMVVLMTDAAPVQNASSPIGKQVLVGIGLLVLAFILWELRDAVPSWLAKNFTVTAEFSTTSERDDSRVIRAFDAVRRSFAADAILEQLPNRSQVRHTRLTVMVPTSDQAVAVATEMSEAMAKAFAREG